MQDKADLEEQKMRISVIGLGYIGLPTALIMAANGNVIVGTDKSEELVAKLNRGEMTFEEEGLQELFQRAVENHIQFTTTYHSVYEKR